MVPLEMENLKGDLSITEEKIKTIIGKSPVAVVFVTESEKILWKYLKEDGYVPDYLLNTVNEFDRLESDIVSLIPSNCRKRMLIHLGKTLFSAFLVQEKDKSILQDHFKEIRKSVEERANERARFCYVVSGLFTSMLIAIGCLVCLIFEDKLIVPFKYDTVLIGAGFGAIGASMSLLQRNKKLRVDSYSTTRTYLLQGFIQIMVGVLSGVFFVLVIKGDIIFGVIKENKSLLAALAVISGFSERFIPEFIRGLEDKYTMNKKTEEENDSGKIKED